MEEHWSSAFQSFPGQAAELFSQITAFFRVRSPTLPESPPSEVWVAQITGALVSPPPWPAWLLSSTSFLPVSSCLCKCLQLGVPRRCQMLEIISSLGKGKEKWGKTHSACWPCHLPSVLRCPRLQHAFFCHRLRVGALLP